MRTGNHDCGFVGAFLRMEWTKYGDGSCDLVKVKVVTSLFKLQKRNTGATASKEELWTGACMLFPGSSHTVVNFRLLFRWYISCCVLAPRLTTVSPGWICAGTMLLRVYWVMRYREHSIFGMVDGVLCPCLTSGRAVGKSVFEAFESRAGG